MGKIKQMSESLANQIAAGEVVERPASVVKELVENAIDADSSEIIVELKEAGIQQIIVTDNGEGMDKTDLKLAFLPHATSKIFNLSDLQRIYSLGFRGEALASIGSVSKVRIESAQANAEQAGHFIEVEGSKVVAEGLTQAKVGTKVIVNSLFYNTPARLKHLSSLKTELRHILNFVQDTSMAHPNIRFVVMNEGQRIFLAYGNGDLRQTIANVYQPSIARQLIEVSGSDNDFEIHGFISPPTLTRTNRQYINWLVNNRPIKSYILNQVLLNAYGRQLMIGRFPIVVLNINLDPQLLDVNVHPTKQTVRFGKEEELSQLIKTVIQEGLKLSDPIPNAEIPSPSISDRNKQTSLEVNELTLDFNEKKQPYIDKTDFSSTETANNYVNSKHSETNEQAANQQIEETPIEESETAQSISKPIQNNPIDFKQLRYIGQIHGTYLIAEHEDGFYLIDQHAAQEKIRYEEMMTEDTATEFQQQLLMPLVFHFSQGEVAEIEEILPRLQNMGVHLTPFGPQSFQLESYPNWLMADEVEKVIRDMTELLVDQPELSIQQIKEKSIIMQSCRGAIKANHYLDKQQAIALIEQLNHLEDPYHCPHGRPVFVSFTQNMLEKFFKRIQDSHEKGYYR